MNDLLFRVVLPSYLVVGLATLALKRLLLVRRTGRDPIRVRPLRSADTAAGFAEAALVFATSALALDVLARAIWPRQSEALLTFPLLVEAPYVRWSGFLLMSSGLLLYFIGLAGLGESWRIGIDSEHPGPLVTGGLFAHIRHPLYSGILLATLGMAVLMADIVSVSSVAAAWTAIPIQARLEEEFLERQYPEYGDYRSRTGRFIPKWP